MLADLRGTSVAYVADADARAVHLVDVDARSLLGSTPLDATPAQVLVLADGRVAVTLRDANEIAILEPAADATSPLARLCSRAVPSDPFGLAATPDDATLLVTSAWAGQLTAVSAKDASVGFSVSLPREPRAVLVDDDGRRAFVSHAVGAGLSVVELESKRAVRAIDLRVKARTRQGSKFKEVFREGAQGFSLVKAPSAPSGRAPSGRLFAPMVSVDLTGTLKFGGGAGMSRHTHIVSVVDVAAERALTKAWPAQRVPSADLCLLPRDAALRATSSTLLVACLGEDVVVELDARGVDPSRLPVRRFRVPPGPVGVAVDDARSRAVVWSQFAGAVSVLELGATPTVTSVVLGDKVPLDVAEIAQGRELFHLVQDKRVSADGLACASCHPDGRDDALTWPSPGGALQTPMLAGRLRPPFGWSGTQSDLAFHVAKEITGLRGTGLGVEELDWLVAYLKRLPAPTRPPPADAQRVARGQQVFSDRKNGCAACHVAGTGRDGRAHDLGAPAAGGSAKAMGTPSLAFVGGTAPYLHDGRFPTLQALLTSTDGAAVHNPFLARSDLEALLAYLETL